jgi:hypothetical protein
MPKHDPNGVLHFLEATLDCDVATLSGWMGLTAKEARKILNDCALNTVCGGYCRRLIDNAATCLDRIRGTLGDESNETEDFIRLIVYTCVITITG